MMSRAIPAYSEMSATTPAPTVRPPSRIANRSSFSSATGVLSSTPTAPVCPPPSSFVSTYTSALNVRCGLIDPGLASTCPRSTSSLSMPRNSAPILSPPCPPSQSFRNTSTPVPPLFTPPHPPPHIPPRLPLVQELPEHLPPRHHRLPRLRRHPHDLHLVPHLHDPPLHPPGDHGPPARNGEYVLDRHQKGLVHRPRRRRNVAVHRLHQLPDALGRLRVLRLLHRPQRRAPHHRNRVPRKLVLLQQLPHLQLHQVQDLRVVHHVHLVHEHHQVRHVPLPRQQHVLPRLGHRPVVGRHHQDRPVHLRRPRDHVLDVVRVPRTVDVRVVPLRRLVLHVRHRNRDPPLPLLRGVVDRPEVPHRHLLVLRQR